MKTEDQELIDAFKAELEASHKVIRAPTIANKREYMEAAKRLVDLAARNELFGILDAGFRMGNFAAHGNRELCNYTDKVAAAYYRVSKVN